MSEWLQAIGIAAASLGGAFWYLRRREKRKDRAELRATLDRFAAECADIPPPKPRYPAPARPKRVA